ncbi:MAG: hypothetical protein BMS9Abin26_1448 [Gammaproteobacteria bacterium]|nr:MAG: hypothetical protein BMS9Abin26_1448 [Gammaproteobacteria bacterium]
MNINNPQGSVRKYLTIAALALLAAGFYVGAYIIFGKL